MISKKFSCVLLSSFLILETIPLQALNNSNLEGNPEKSYAITETLFDGSTQKGETHHFPIVLAQSDAFGQYPSGDPRAIPQPKKPDRPIIPQHKQDKTQREPSTNVSPKSSQNPLSIANTTPSSSSQEEKALKFLFWGFVATFGIVASLGVGGLALSGAELGLAWLASVIGGIGTLFNLDGGAVFIEEVIAPLILGPILGLIDAFIPGETSLNEASKELGLLSQVTYWALRVSLLLGSLAYFPLLGAGVLSGLPLLASIPIGIASGAILFSNILYPVGEKIKNSITRTIEERRIKRQEKERQKKEQQDREIDRKANNYIQSLHQEIDQLSANKELSQEETYKRLQKKLKETRLDLRSLPPSHHPNDRTANHYLSLKLPESGAVPIQKQSIGESWGTVVLDKKGSLVARPFNPLSLPAESLASNGSVTSIEMELRDHDRGVDICTKENPCFRIHDANDQSSQKAGLVAAIKPGVILLTGKTSEGGGNQIFMVHFSKGPIDFDKITELEFTRNLHLGESTKNSTRNGILVSPGEHVHEREVIGIAGNTGLEGTKTHAHTDRFVVREGDPGWNTIKKDMETLEQLRQKHGGAPPEGTKDNDTWSKTINEVYGLFLQRVNVGPVTAKGKKGEATRDVYARRYGYTYQNLIKPNLSKEKQEEIDKQLDKKQK